ncbi:FliA/WhiG family RNA polymerase sigma factor [bacterium]|nr:FliA/WhiG family RNA polymerase sigma factor [bacterium]
MKMQEIRTKEQKDLILNHIFLVKNIAANVLDYLPSSIDMNDLIEAGIIGLIDAAQKYDPSKQSKFSNYAKFRIRGAIMDELRGMDFVSRSVRSKAKMVENTILCLEQRLGRAVMDDEVASELGMNMEQFYKIRKQMHTATLVHIEDIDEMMGNSDDGYSFIDLLSDDSDKRILDDITIHEMSEIILEAMYDLPEKQRQVLMLYYWDDYTMKEVGHMLGLAESTVSTHHNEALIKLKRALKNRQATIMFSLNN